MVNRCPAEHSRARCGPTPCPVCGRSDVALLRDRGAIEGDLAAALARGHKLVQSMPADVHACNACGSVFRDAAQVPVDLVDRYRDDQYVEMELVRLHRLGTSACIRDLAWFHEHGVARGRRVLEIGSYEGSFLSVARATGCEALGVDVGREVSEFARGLGLEVLTGELEPGALPSESFDAVFVLNCFEQLPDPTATLWEIRRLLRPAGDLVLRTPSAAFVRQAHLPPRRHHANNRGVLGVPFVRCFSAGALVGVLRAASFTTVAVRGASAPWMDVAARAA